MRRKDVVASVLVALVVILITAGPVLAQTNLVPNEQKDNDHMWGGDSNSYMATLEIGHWTVTVETLFDLQVKITVALDSGYTDVISVSGEGSGNFPVVDFTLNENATVYIRVDENSVYGDTSGYYDIGVYDDAHVPSPPLTNLVPNEQRSNDHMWDGESNFYMADLGSGHWTVTVEPTLNLEVKITVALDSGYTDVISVSGEGSGNFPVVDFTLNESATVYIRVDENSVYGDTAGVYDISVYDDAHIQILPLLGLDFVSLMIILGFGIPLVLCIVCVLFARRNAKALGTISTDSAYDITVLPRKTRKLLREQLPTNCPNCDGGLTYGTVRWVGPRTAECPYCGSPVLLETVEIDID